MFSVGGRINAYIVFSALLQVRIVSRLSHEPTLNRFSDNVLIGLSLTNHNESLYNTTVREKHAN